MDKIVQILVDMLCWLLLILGGSYVDYRSLVRFACNDSYHMDLSMALYKVSCDKYASCPRIWQDQTSMTLYTSNQVRCSRKVRTIGERLVIAKKVLDECVDFSRWIVEFGIWGCMIHKVFRYIMRLVWH